MMRSNHPLFRKWSNMIVRCHGPKNATTKNYGDRGISVCDRWKNDFWAFVADVGERPTEQHSMDRIDNNGDYEPSNVRWATPKEQSRNTRVNRYLSVGNKTQILEDWVIETGINRATLYKRIELGWTDEEVVTTPVAYHRPRRAAMPPGDVARCKELGIKPKTICGRMRLKGWSLERALIEPVRRTKSSRFIGVRQVYGKWRTCIRVNGKWRHVGMFREEVDAALAYNLAAVELLGSDHGPLNTREARND